MRAFLSWMSLYGIGLVLGGGLLLWRAVAEARRAPGGRHRRRVVDPRRAGASARAEASAQREANAVPVGIVDAPDLSQWPEPAWAEGRVRGQAAVYSTTADDGLEFGASEGPLGRVTEPLDEPFDDLDEPLEALDELPEPQPTARPR